MGKRERDRLRSLDAVALSMERKPRKDHDEVFADRGVVLLPERGGMSTLYNILGFDLQRYYRTSW